MSRHGSDWPPLWSALSECGCRKDREVIPAIRTASPQWSETRTAAALLPLEASSPAAGKDPGAHPSTSGIAAASTDSFPDR